MPRLHRKTKRLTLRPLKLQDFEAWKTYVTTMSGPKSVWDRQTRAPSDPTRSQFKNFLQKQKKHRDLDQFYDLAVFENKTGQMVGRVAVMDVLRGLTQSAFIGYFIHNRFWGQGYGKEATLALIDIGFRDLKLHRLEAGIEPRNRRSIRLARSLKLRKEGLKKRALYRKGKWQDLVVFAATSEEFGVRWKAAGRSK